MFIMMILLWSFYPNCLPLMFRIIGLKAVRCKKCMLTFSYRYQNKILVVFETSCYLTNLELIIHPLLCTYFNLIHRQSFWFSSRWSCTGYILGTLITFVSKVLTRKIIIIKYAIDLYACTMVMVKLILLVCITMIILQIRGVIISTLLSFIFGKPCSS